jgi:hypothetical protein
MVAIRPVVLIAAAFAVLAPVNAGAEAFASYWSTLSEGERVFVDCVAASMYSEERGKRIESYSRLNSASKARFRARAVEALGVENRPARVRKKAKEL